MAGHELRGAQRRTVAREGDVARFAAAAAADLFPRRSCQLQPGRRFLFQLNLRGLLRQQQPPLLLNRSRQLQPGRRFLFLSGERKRKSAEKRKKASGFGYGESGDGVRTCGAEKRRLISPTTAVSLRPECRQVGLALSSAVFGLQPCGHFSKDVCPHQVLRKALR
jgi:hypothetical protein